MKAIYFVNCSHESLAEITEYINNNCIDIKTVATNGRDPRFWLMEDYAAEQLMEDFDYSDLKCLDAVDALADEEDGMELNSTNVGKFITGFDTFEQAEALADKYGLEVHLLSRREGSGFLVNHGWTTHAIEVDEDFLKVDSVRVMLPGDDYWTEEMLPVLEDEFHECTRYGADGFGRSRDEFDEWYRQQCRICDEVESLEDDQVLAVFENQNTEVFNRYNVRISWDSTVYLLAIM